MGAIIFWSIIRTAVIIPLLWITGTYIDYESWWVICIVAVYVTVIHPAIVQFKKFEEDNREVLEDTLCSSCKSFNKSAVICIKYDQHPTKTVVPCEGMDWEPVSDEDYKEKEYD